MNIWLIATEQGFVTRTGFDKPYAFTDIHGIAYCWDLWEHAETVAEAGLEAGLWDYPRVVSYAEAAAAASCGRGIRQN